MENELNKLIGTPVEIELLSPIVKFEGTTLSNAIIKRVLSDCAVVKIENKDGHILLSHANIAGIRWCPKSELVPPVPSRAIADR